MKIALPPEIAATIREHPAFAQELTRLAQDIAAGRIAENSPAIDDFVARVKAVTKPSVKLVIQTAQEMRPPESPPPESGPEASPPPPTDRDGDIEYPSRLPDDCPVVPLGDDEAMSYYLDPSGRQIGLEAQQHGRLYILKLFGDRQDWLYQIYPRRKFVRDKNNPADAGAWITIGIHFERVAEHLMAAAHRKGFWLPHQRVRHIGLWTDGAVLLLHCGDKLLERNPGGRGFIERRPGMIGNYLYPARPAVLHPYHLSVSAGDRRIARIRETLGTWTFLGGDFDADLLFGGIGCAFIPGGLRWRPNLWLTGGSGTGKSTLRRYIAALLHKRLLAVDRSTEAGVREWVTLAAICIALDEAEAEEDNRALDKLVQQARSAAGGALVLRGSAQQKVIEYLILCSYIFSSVLVPPLPPQDRNRFCIVSLGPLTHAQPPEIDTDQAAEDGRCCLRRLLDQWNELSRAIADYRAALVGEKISARTADLYSPLLATRHVLLSDRPVGDAADMALKVMERENIGGGEDNTIADEWRCVHRLTATLLPLDGSSFRRPVREWLARRWFRASFEHDMHDPDRILASYGLAYVVQGEEPDAGKAQEKPELWVTPPRYLAVANAHPELEKVFQGTHWRARAGADGPWKQTLERLPGACHDNKTKHFPGKGNSRYVLIPLAHVFDTAEAEMWRKRLRPTFGETTTAKDGAA